MIVQSFERHFAPDVSVWLCTVGTMVTAFAGSTAIVPRPTLEATTFFLVVVSSCIRSPATVAVKAKERITTITKNSLRQMQIVGIIIVII